MSESNNKSNDKENHVLQLVPIQVETKERLENEAGRPALTVGTNPPVFLGDNDTTCIIDPRLSEIVVKVYLKGTKIFAFAQSDAQGGVVVNDSLLPPGTRHKIQVGDCIGLTSSMYSAKMEYAYKLERVDAATAASRAKMSASLATPAKLPQEVAEETCCAICMEIMVQPHSVVPCGHTFCKGCLGNQSQCASCRGPIQSKIPCRSLQNLIGLFTSSKCRDVSIYEESDLDSYHTRSNKKPSPARASGGCSRKHQRISRREARRSQARTAAVHPASSVPRSIRVSSRTARSTTGGGSSIPNAISIE